jgi:hypothetical protein
VVISANRSCPRSITSVIGLIGVLTGWFLGAIKCIKEQSANIVVILKAWVSIKGLKVVRNVSKVSYS